VGTQRDVMEDFQSEVDKIVLGFDADTTTPYGQEFQWRGFDGFSGAAGELHLVEAWRGVFLESGWSGVMPGPWCDGANGVSCRPFHFPTQPHWTHFPRLPAIAPRRAPRTLPLHEPNGPEGMYP